MGSGGIAYDSGGNCYINGSKVTAVVNDLSYKCNTADWNTNYGITFDEKYIEAVVKQISDKLYNKSVELYDGPEIPKWTGFINI